MTTPSSFDEKRQPKRYVDELLERLPLERFINRNPVVAVLRLSGVIGSGKSMDRTPQLCLDSLNEQIEETFNMSRLKMVALQINSPGGSPVQTELLYKRIRFLADEKNVPVIAFVESAAASGGYWLACCADEIYASENSLIGSIGVVAGGFGFPELMKKLGVERRLYTQGENKAMLDPFSPEKKEHVDLFLEVEKDLHDSFKRLVKERRKGKLKGKDAKLFNGEFWTGLRALEYGLIDGIGDMYSVIKERYGDEITIKKMETKKGIIKRIISGQAFLPSLIDAALDRVEARVIWSRLGL